MKPWAVTPGEVIAKVQANIARLYIKDGGCPFAVIMHATLSAYGNECINHALAKKPTSPHELATAISDFEATHGNATRSRFRPSQPRQGPPPYRVKEKPRQHVISEKWELEPPVEKKQYPPNRKYEVTCFLCQKKRHLRAPLRSQFIPTQVC